MSQNLSRKDVDELLKKDIIEILGLSHLPEERKNSLREKILSTVQNRVMLRIGEMLEKKGKTSDFAKVDSDETVERFFAENGIDTDKIFFEEAIAYKAQLATTAEFVSKGVAPRVATAT